MGPYIGKNGSNLRPPWLPPGQRQGQGYAQGGAGQGQGGQGQGGAREGQGGRGGQAQGGGGIQGQGGSQGQGQSEGGGGGRQGQGDQEQGGGGAGNHTWQKPTHPGFPKRPPPESSTQLFETVGLWTTFCNVSEESNGDYYNEMASLLQNRGHETVKLLFDEGTADVFSAQTLATFFCIYFFLAVTTYAK